MERLLRAAFGVDVPGSRDDIVHDVVDKPFDEGAEPFRMCDDHITYEQFYESANPLLN